MAGTAIVVRYTEVPDFLADLEADRSGVERDVLHVTKLARPGGPGGAITAVLVHAGAIVDGRPMVLECFVGYLWDGPEDGKVQRRASELVQALAEGAGRIDLELRGGMLEVREADRGASA